MKDSAFYFALFFLLAVFLLAVIGFQYFPQ